LRARARGAASAGAAVLALAAVTGLTLAGQGAGSTGTAPTAVPVTSNYERATGRTISRDCGYSSPLPGKPDWSLWLFCDTEVTGHAHGASPPPARTLILGTDTAAAGPYTPGQVPSSLSEIPTPPGQAALPNKDPPQPFAPAPASLRLPGGIAPCAGDGAYPAAWVSGLTPATGTAELLVTFDDYCVTADDDQPEGFSIAEYNPAGNILSPPTAVFGTAASGLALPERQALGSPIVKDGYLYLFSRGRRGVFLTRVPAAAAYWQNPFAYQYRTGSGWSAQPAAATPLPGPGRPLSIAVSDFTADGHGLVMIEQTTLAGAFTAWQAASPGGPWRQTLSGRVPCAKTSTTGAAGQGAGTLCRALIGHPELSNRDRILISYFNPGTRHADMSAFPW
jgi:hypothetical protein